MKKITLSIVTIISAMILSACGNSNAVSTPTSTPTPTPVIEAMKLADTDEQILSDYLSEYDHRLTSSSFLTEDEQNAFKSLGYTIISNFAISDPNSSNEELYYPILFEEDNGNLVPIGVNIYGNLNCPSNDIYTLHSDGKEISGDCIMSSPHAKVYYDPNTGIVQQWSFGKQLKEVRVPQGSVYAGHSFWEGYIFRHNTDVYSISSDFTSQVVPIAHNVQMVLTTDYCLTSDCWSQPLFLMTDGSVKCYVGWNGDQEVLDDISHLSDVSSDGGFVGTYYPYNE